MKFLLFVLTIFNSLIVFAQNHQPEIEITDLHRNQFFAFQTVTENQDSIQFLTLKQEKITLAFSDIHEIKLFTDGQWISVYRKIVPDSLMKDSLTKFSVNDLMLQTFGGYLIGIASGIGTGFIINNSTPDPSGFLSVVGGIMTFAVISPFVVQYIGESIDEPRQIKSHFPATCIGAATGGLISGGILIPIGASVGYQSNKCHIPKFVDSAHAPDWVLKRVGR